MSREFRPGRAGARWPCTGAVSKLGISGPGHPLFCTYIPDDGVSFRASRVEPGMYASCAHISDSQKTRGYASQAAIRPPIQIEGLAGMLILSSIPPSLPDFFFLLAAVGLVRISHTHTSLQESTPRLPTCQPSQRVRRTYLRWSRT